jgi:hypothetical protein
MALRNPQEKEKKTPKIQYKSKSKVKRKTRREITHSCIKYV